MTKRAVVTTWLVAMVLVACTGGGTSEPGPSGSSSSGSAGSSGSTGTAKPVARVAATATLSGDSCPQKGELPAIGSLSLPVDDKGVWSDKTAAVTCSIISSGPSFSVQALATLGDHEVEYQLNGLVPTTAPAGISNVKVTGNGGLFVGESCQVEYPAQGGLASGRFWANLTCINVSGNMGCTLKAEVRFENCAQ